MKMYDEFELDLTNEETANKVSARGMSSNVLTMLTSYSIRNCTKGCDQVTTPTKKNCKTVNTCRTMR